MQLTSGGLEKSGGKAVSAIQAGSFAPSRFTMYSYPGLQTKQKLSWQLLAGIAVVSLAFAWSGLSRRTDSAPIPSSQQTKPAPSRPCKILPWMQPSRSPQARRMTSFEPLERASCSISCGQNYQDRARRRWPLWPRLPKSGLKWRSISPKNSGARMKRRPRGLKISWKNGPGATRKPAGIG